MKNQIKIEIKKGNELSERDIGFIVKINIKTFICCKNYEKELKILKDEEMKSSFFFVKKDSHIMSFGLLRPIKIKYLGKDYNLFGISNMVSIKKGKGYGKILVQAMKDFLSKRGKTGFGFCSNKNTEFYKKSGMIVKRKLKNRFFYNYGDSRENKEAMQDFVIYWEGKDKFVTKVLKTKSLIKIPCEHW
ncbi:hypothetical protein KAI32_01330 [Candidatus Pacearchaeota archaeon]|nr:hypothetical protein [Candidatus Pacearchaeota archaeon]